jgi:6-phosphogluconate dehydrogenase
MGRNLLLNFADHGFRVAGLDTDPAKVAALAAEAADRPIAATIDARLFLEQLQLPRAIILLVPAGKAVDAVIAQLTPHLTAGDLVIDAGNSHFTDTERRSKELAAKNLNFFGLGVSGGETGARRGPSLMPGGPREAFERVRPMLEAVAAKVDWQPCVAWLGPGAAGHYVKMVHNGIEYGVMQILAEAYDLMHRGFGLDNLEMAHVFAAWNKAELQSFLVEITASILKKLDDKTGKHLVDVILDVARQKGTGKWTSQEAMDVQTPLLTIDAAVAMRDVSAYDQERTAASRLLDRPVKAHREHAGVIDELGAACYAAILTTYAQGFALLRKASQVHGYNLELATVARIWRGGCIIRAALLEDIRAAYEAQPQLANMLLDPRLAQELMKRDEQLRAVVRMAVDRGIPATCLMNSLAYIDAYRSARLPTNLIQAQRDFFGAHTYERVDEPGTFHTHWE